VEYLDFELEIRAGRGRSYPVAVLRSSAGEAEGTLRFPFTRPQLEGQLTMLENALLRSARAQASRRILPAHEQAVQTFGQALFEALFDNEVRDRYEVARADARRQGKGLRIKLRIEPPELAALPWEYLFDERRGEFLSLSQHTPLVRYLDVAEPIEPLAVTPPLRVLGLVASPADPNLDTLDVEQEQRRVERALAPLRERGLLELTWLPGRTFRDLQRALRAGPWHVFHFVGHGGFDAGSGEGVLVLEDETGGPHELGATRLGRLLADHLPLRLIVLNSCDGARASVNDVFSSTAAALARRAVPAVLAMQFEISDAAAIELARSFYEGLADGLPIDAAVAQARIALSLAQAESVEWGTPVLHLRAPDGVLFRVQSGPGGPPIEAGNQTGECEQASEFVTRTPAATPGTSSAFRSHPRTGTAESAFVLAGRAATLGKLGRYEEALADFNRALELAPDDAYALAGRGATLRKLGRYDEALADLNRALALAPTYVYALSRRGATYANLGRHEEALADFSRALELEPGNAWSIKNRDQVAHNSTHGYVAASRT
jgi:tetratricopeptide (TPR) repeat protein